ncbi:MAG: glycoside hydrolase [Armatimonadetes bacterium]|nr:glycoside hydrolase [Armatimonadota bacterium]
MRPLWTSLGLAPFVIGSAVAQPIDPLLTRHLSWRCIGPHRGGRTVGAVGVPGKPNEFLIGVNNGGVWKTTDYGRTWVPVFDDQPTGSVGWVSVAPSDGDTVYVGCGEGLQRPDLSVGDGVYKSKDGGRTWVHVGLRDVQQIACMAVDPRSADTVYVAALGHPYGPNAERGLYKTTDGGSTWRKVLGPDAETGAAQVVIDPKRPDTVYCALWAGRQGPWENGRWQGPKSGLYKSTDGGETWNPVMNGMPTIAQGLGRIGIGVAPSDPDRIYATVDAREKGGVYRSDDAGRTWKLLDEDHRLWGRGDDFAEIKVDPLNADTVYCANTAAYKSTDGGHTWTCWKGAPGGDDYHTVWIDPVNPQTVLMASDQGATITVNGGATWSSWYNQPTAQFYHVSTDDQWPYMVYGGQQESGSVGIRSRGDDGQVTFREWHPVGVEEYGYVAVDPTDPDIVFGGKITKFDKRTGQVQNVSPEAVRSGKYRFLRTAPVLFSPVDKKLLYFAGNVLFASTDRGGSWKVLSSDLSREKPDVPSSFQTDGRPMAEPGRRGVVYSVGPSHFTTDTVWCGTDDGLVWVTQNGGKDWKDVTPPGLTSWSKVSQIDAGHFDDATAYVAVNRIRCDDPKPYVYVTHDYGRTWKLAVSGLPDDPVNAVREDPSCPGLLYAATERMVHVSLDDGANWSPLRLNMPCTSVRDLVVHDDDLVIGTHGRSFWILDNVSSLRSVCKDRPSSSALLFPPQLATRVRWNMNTDTPLPPEEPGGKNPPDGAILDYWLPADAKSVVIEVLDGDLHVVRRYSSDDVPFRIDPKTVPSPTYWLREPKSVGTTKGAHRWLWDMRRDPLTVGGGVPMTAVLRDTPFGATGPWAPIGTYTVRLTVDGASVEQPLTLRLDPRVTTSPEGLTVQSEMLTTTYRILKTVAAWRNELQTLGQALKSSSKAEDVARLKSIEQALGGTGPGPSIPSLELGCRTVMSEADESDMSPTEAVRKLFDTCLTQYLELEKTMKNLRG